MGVLSSALLICVLAAALCSAWRRGSHVLDEVPLIEGNNWLPYRVIFLENGKLSGLQYDTDLTRNSKWVASGYCQSDMPRLRRGKVGATFFAAVAWCKDQQDFVEKTKDQITLIRSLSVYYPSDLKFVDSVKGIEDAFNQGMIGTLIGVEGGHLIDSRLDVLRQYYTMGARYMTLTHICDTPWAGTAFGNKGLTAFGKEVVLEMNRLGMMVDLAHASHATRQDALDNTKAPVIFSHTAAAAICNNPENIDDDFLRRMMQNGGIVMVTFSSHFLRCDNTSGTMEDVVAHINHVRNIAGADHVGIGSSYHGHQTYPVGLEDVSHFPELFDRLANNKPNEPYWSDEELRKLAGLNLLRVFRRVEEVRDELTKKKPPSKEQQEQQAAQVCKTDLPQVNLTDSSQQCSGTIVAQGTSDISSLLADCEDCQHTLCVSFVCSSVL